MLGRFAGLLLQRPSIRFRAIRNLKAPTVSWLSERLSKQISKMGALDLIQKAAEKVE